MPTLPPTTAAMAFPIDSGRARLATTPKTCITIEARVMRDSRRTQGPAASSRPAPHPR